MATAVAATSLPNALPASRASATPRWYLWCVALAVTSANVGGQWDIAWHRSIGRDGFWTAPHIAIYLCGVLAGIACGYLILTTTFGPPAGKAASVQVLGFRGPLGAFIASWGGFAMLASAPFDNWWHGAYGLDVKILSPPHVILMGGALAVQIGALVLILGEMNRAEGLARRWLTGLFLYGGGMILCSQLTGTMEYTSRDSMHSAMFYRVCAIAFAPVLVALARAAGVRWAATISAAVYTGFYLALLWLLPLAHAAPKLGPVYHQVTTLLPAGFPLLLLAPAVAIDLALQRFRAAPAWRLALILGGLFFVALLVVQWPFADFLNSPLAWNAFFGSGYLDYTMGPESEMARNVYDVWEATRGEFWVGMGIALLVAVAMARVGLAFGNWMRELRR